MTKHSPSQHPPMTVGKARRLRRVRRMEPDELIEKYTSLVKSAGREIVNLLKIPIELDDLLGWGFQGLLEANERFNLRAEVSFSTYAYYRVRGAMFDGLRDAGWAVRGTAIQIRDCVALNDYMDDRVMAYAMTPQAETLEEGLQRLENIVGECVTICLLQHSELERVTRASDPEQHAHVEQHELHRILNEAMEKLAPEEREVLSRYYVMEESMAQVASALGVSTSWVSRLHASAIHRMHTILTSADSQPCAQGWLRA